jgi:4-carboxymuconolactone decarboxylase
MTTSKTLPRILPLAPPYSPEVEESLDKMMGPKAAHAPLKLFRTLLRHPRLGDRIRPLGSGILAHGLVDPRERELLILRTCARAGCEYEWGVHIEVFARPLGFTEEQINATITGPADASIWTERQSLLIRLADDLHETARVSAGLWERLARQWDSEQMIELLMICGWYHLIAFVANGAAIECEPWAARFPTSSV